MGSYPVNCKAICSNHPLLHHNWPEQHLDDCGGLMLSWHRWWWQLMTVDDKNKPLPSSKGYWVDFLLHYIRPDICQIFKNLSGWSWPTRRVCLFWSRSRGRTRIEWLCSELAPYSTWQPQCKIYQKKVLQICHLFRSSLRMSVLWANIRLGLPSPALQRPVAGSCMKT